MECWFDDLAYAVQDKSTGTIAIVERKEETAFLTKYLRVYGGTGEYKGYKVGRVLKNIVFGGQGLVKNPANPESVIKVAANLSEGGMNMDKEVAKQLEDALASVAERDKKIESLTKDLEGAKSASNIYETKVKEVDQKIQELLSQLGKATETIKASEIEKAELTKKVEEVTAEYNKVKAEVDAINKANKAKERIEKLSKVKTLTEAEVKEVGDMSDETFNTVLKYASVNPVKQETEASTASLDVVVRDEPEFQGGDDNIEDKSAQLALATAKCLLKVNKEGGEK
jgi:chromosome segregation ATPase